MFLLFPLLFFSPCSTTKVGKRNHIHHKRSKYFAKTKKSLPLNIGKAFYNLQIEKRLSVHFLHVSD